MKLISVEKPFKLFYYSLGHCPAIYLFMPSKKYTSKYQNYCKVTVYFNTGTKPYRMALEKKNDFLKKLKARKDVIKYTVETFRVYIS